MIISENVLKISVEVKHIYIYIYMFDLHTNFQLEQ